MSRWASPILTLAALLLAGVYAGGSVSPGIAQNSRLAVFETTAKGEWTIRFRDGSASRKVCVRSGEELLQLQHGKPGCNQVIISNDAQEATVQYACKGNGYGRTTVRRETRSLLQLSSQGIADERPFQFYAEARHSGECS